MELFHKKISFNFHDCRFSLRALLDSTIKYKTIAASGASRIHIHTQTKSHVLIMP